MPHDGKNLNLTWLPGRFALARLDRDAAVPDWAETPGNDQFISVTRTAEELSIIAPQQFIPPDVTAERDFVAFRVIGKLEFTTVGVLARLSNALADADISIVAMSTFDTDYILLKSRDKEAAAAAITRAGMTFTS